MTGTFLLCWAVFPALALLLCTGAGLLVRRAAGREALPNVLVVPVGLATLVVIGGLFCYYAALAPLCAPAFAVVGLAGLVLERRPLLAAVRRGRHAIDIWPVLAGLGGWLVLAAPVLFSGIPTYTGYVHIVDISYELDLAVHFAHSGRSIPPGIATSAYQTVMQKYLESGYPGAGPWTLGGLSNLMPVDLAWLYQPFLALVAGCTALSAYSLLGRVIGARWLRALAAAVAAQPTVLIGYAVAGGIKELCTGSFLVLTVALFALPGFLPRPGRSSLLPPIAIAATIASLSLTTLPWVGILAIGYCLTASLLERGWPARLRALGGSVQMGALTVVLSLPTLAAALKLLPAVKGTGPLELGNLTAPIPGISAAGVWISGDIRYPQYAHQGISKTLDILALVLAGVAVLYAIRRRIWAVPWVAVAGVFSLYYVAHRYGPWIQLKADCITAPVALTLAFFGAGALGRMARGVRITRARVLVAAVPIVAIAAAVLAGNALLYHDTPLAPYQRLHNLQYIGERYARQGPTLTPDFEEDAEYFLRDMNQTSMVNGPTLGLRPEVNRAAEPGGIYVYDINEFSLPWLEGFRTIVMRRNPTASRPPANYRLVYLSRWYEVWQRAQPSSTVVAHVPLKDRAGNLRGAACARVLRAARAAGPSAHILYTASPGGFVQIDASNSVLHGGFVNAGGGIVAVGAGRAERRQPIPASGLYRVYLGGSVARPVQVSIDGHRVGTDAYQINYPGQWVLLGSVRLGKGVHHVEITRGGNSLHPDAGEGIDTLNRQIGPLLIWPAARDVPPLQSASAAAFARMCRSGQSLRWVEVVRGAPA